MARDANPKIVSANDLMDGDVIYLTEDGDWTRRIRRAAVAETEAQASDLLDRAEAQPGRAIGPYLVDVRIEAGTARPLHFRERYRDLGPSNRPDLGRQAELTGL